MQSLKIVSLNIIGGETDKEGSDFRHFYIKKVDVFFLQETHSNPTNVIDWGLWLEGSCIPSHGSYLEFLSK